MFADDTNIFFSSDSYEILYNLANIDLENVNSWLIANKLSLNVNETKHILFRIPNSKPPPDKLKLLIRSELIDWVGTVKFLGLIVHKHLSWKPHMESVSFVWVMEE